MGRFLLKLFCLLLLIGWESVTMEAALGQSLEIKLWPEDKVYTYTVADPWLHDIVLQNVAIINRSGKLVTLEDLQISVLRNGRVTQSRLVEFSNLEPNLKSFFARYKSGALNIWDAEYHLKDFFQDAALVDSSRGKSSVMAALAV